MLTLLLALSCGAEPQFTVENKLNPPRCTCKAGACDCTPDFGGMGRCGCFPEFSVTNKVPSAPVLVDPRGVWSPVWDGRVWHPRWVREGVSQPATHFPSPGTPVIPAPSVAEPSTSFPGVVRFQGRTLTPARQAILGSTNCGPSG